MSKQFHYINLEQVDALAGDDTDFKKELTDIFMEQINEFVPNMKQFFEAQNWDKLAKEAHTAKSSAMTFGMDVTGKLLKTIQLDCEEKKLDKVGQMVNDAIKQLEGAAEELTELKKTL